MSDKDISPWDEIPDFSIKFDLEENKLDQKLIECPTCHWRSTKNYVGFNTVECFNYNCIHYKEELDNVFGVDEIPF
jgi:hypothetical protein